MLEVENHFPGSGLPGGMMTIPSVMNPNLARVLRLEAKNSYSWWQ